jgi:hypothetical protein
MGFSTATANLLILVTILISLAGAVLLWIGYRGRRVGSEPRCRRCGYNLTGAASATCPECGGHGDDIGVVHGLRRRRPVLMLAGIVLVLSGGMFLGFKGYQRVQTINVYRYYPAGWVLDAAIAGQPAALTELARRLRAEGLSDKHRDRLATFALAEQGATTPVGMLQAWVDMLEFLYQAGDLTDAQAEQYFEQMRIYTLAVRAQVCAGDPLPVQLRHTTRGPSGPFPGGESPERWIRVKIDREDISLTEPDAEPAAANPLGGRGSVGCASTAHGVGNTGSCGPMIERINVSPGVYEVNLDFTELIYADNVTDPWEADNPLFSRRLRETAKLEVAAVEACAGVELVDDPALAAEIRDALDFGSVELVCQDAACQTTSVNLMVHTGAGTTAGAALPIDVAFAALLRDGDEELELTSFALRASGNHGYHLQGDLEGFDAETVDVVLRTKAEAARRTVDIIRIWDGELLFEDFPVERKAR